jgi:hypothetical protein
MIKPAQQESPVYRWRIILDSCLYDFEYAAMNEADFPMNRSEGGSGTLSADSLNPLRQTVRHAELHDGNPRSLRAAASACFRSSPFPASCASRFAVTTERTRKRMKLFLTGNRESLGIGLCNVRDMHSESIFLLVHLKYHLSFAPVHGPLFPSLRY